MCVVLQTAERRGPRTDRKPRAQPRSAAEATLPNASATRQGDDAPYVRTPPIFPRELAGTRFTAAQIRAQPDLAARYGALGGFEEPGAAYEREWIVNLYTPFGAAREKENGRPAPAEDRRLPYDLRLSWSLETRTRLIRVNKRVAESTIGVLREVEAQYGLAEIRRLKLDHWGGSYVRRQKRGATRPEWSTHAWGVAHDWNTVGNGLRDKKDAATMAGPDYRDWWLIWEKAGWYSLGRSRGYDYMHVQAAVRVYS